MEKQCQNCQHYTEGVTDRQRHEWEWSNWGRHADGVCNLYFPRGYIGRKPPHAGKGSRALFPVGGENMSTKIRTVDGMIALNNKAAFVPVTLRVTRDEIGQSISLADDKHGFLLEIPVEPVLDLIEVKG